MSKYYNYRVSKDGTKCFASQRMTREDALLSLLYLKESVGNKPLPVEKLKKKFIHDLKEKISDVFQDPAVRNEILEYVLKRIDKSLFMLFKDPPQYIAEYFIKLMAIVDNMPPTTHETKIKFFNEVNNECKEHLDLELDNNRLLTSEDPEYALWVELSSKVFEKIINDAYYHAYRKKLEAWIYRAKGNSRDPIVVKAPLGIGKTVAIAVALNKNKDKSAIIFMPRIELCEKLHDRFDKTECYLIEGVTRGNCDYFEEVLQHRYERIGKGSVCDDCEKKKKKECKIISQYKEARKYRIIITTHAQYKRFYQAQLMPDEWGWEYKTDRCKPRDFFVIDENIFFDFMKSCTVTNDEFQRDIGLILKSKIKFDYPLKERLRLLARKVANCNVSSLIAPLDRDIMRLLSSADIKRWGKIMGEASRKDKLIIRNLRDLYLTAIQYGLVVRMRQPDRKKPMVKELYFFEPFHIDLNIQDEKENKIIPRHVFFDATEVKEEVFNFYFPGVKRKEIEIDVPSLGRIPTIKYEEDLSKSSFRSKTSKRVGTKRFLNKIIDKHGDDIGYFVISIKERRDFIIDCFKHREIYTKGSEEAKDKKGYLVVCHYGAQAGMNDAEECRVGILLGTFRLPTEAIAYSALPYIQDKLDLNKIYRIKGDILLRTDRQKARVYHDRFSYLEEFDFWRRSVEQEQGIGRVRHLYHDVDFYAVTKDNIKGYWMYKDADNLITMDDLSNRIFTQKERKDSKRHEFERVARRRWQEQGYFESPAVAKELGLNPSTIQKWIKKLDYIQLAKGYKTKRYVFVE